MHINEEGIALIKLFEGLRLEAYQDVAGVWTIGYGHTKTAKKGMTISEREAEALLREDVREAEQAVTRLVKAPLNENEFSALVSFVFNIGEGAFARSTALRRLNAGDREGAAAAIELFNKATINGKKQTIPGLVRRRAAEKALFLKPVPGAAREAERSHAHGPDSGLVPSDSEGAAKSLGQSRTIKGAAATAAGGAAATATGVATQIQDKQPFIEKALAFAQAHANELLIALGALVLLASLYVLYARIDDWLKGKR
jgi:lysozyme